MKKFDKMEIIFFIICLIPIIMIVCYIVAVFKADIPMWMKLLLLRGR